MISKKYIIVGAFIIGMIINILFWWIYSIKNCPKLDPPIVKTVIKDFPKNPPIDASGQNTTRNLRKRLRIVLSIAVTKLDAKFIEPLIDSAEKYFLPMHEVHYIVTSNAQLSRKYLYHPRVHDVHETEKSWPHGANFRWKAIINGIKSGVLGSFDYIFSIHPHSRFFGLVGDEILGNWVGVLHPEQASFFGTEVIGSNPQTRYKSPQLRKGDFFYDQREFLGGKRSIFSFTTPQYDKNVKSSAFVDPKHPKAKYYFQNGFIGGKPQTVARILDLYTKYFAEDVARGYRAKFDDESYLNRINFEEPPNIVLGPGYMHPLDFDSHPWLWVGWSDYTKLPPLTARLINEVKIGKLDHVDWQWPTHPPVSSTTPHSGLKSVPKVHPIPQKSSK